MMDVRCGGRDPLTSIGGIGLQGLADGGAAFAARGHSHRAVRLRALRPLLDDAQVLDVGRTVNHTDKAHIYSHSLMHCRKGHRNTLDYLRGKLILIKLI